MGLGKTVQVIAFLSGMFDAELIQTVLLIMPTTLISNWMKEFANWTPGLRVKVFHGTSKADRSRNLERIQRRNGVLITTYQMLINNWQQLSSFDRKAFVWDYVVLDEAHKIKDPSAKTTKSVHAIPSKNRILLTGTPVQNNLKELWSLFDYACQGSLLGTMKTFKMEYENPITRARAKDATPGEKALGLKISENLMSIIKPYFLRRSKGEIQKELRSEVKSNLPRDSNKAAPPAMPSLPRKNDLIVWVYLAPIQEEIYRNFLSLEHIKELLMTSRSPLAELTILKKLCDHPRLLSARACSQLGLEVSDYSDLAGGENEADRLLGMKRKIEHVSDETLVEESGKLRFLVALLQRLQEEGHRTLVFSQSVKMLDIIERILIHRHFKIMRIDGTVTHLVEREKRIDVFQNDKDYSVFLLTTQVGGVGITLTAATRVVIFDPSWNPATDAQAVDRVYRIGQKKNVVIYRLITCGTVEEKIYRRQVFKDSLIRQTTGDKKNPYRYFTMQELRELFTLEDTQSSTTQLQLQSLHGNQRKTDSQLDEHIAYLHLLAIFGISDHDLIYTHETVHEDEAENEEAHRYIEHRVQKAQELVQLESQLKDQLMENIKNTTEGAWLREIESSIQPRKKSPKPYPNPSLSPPVYVEPTNENEVVSLVTEDDNNSIINISSKMTSLVIEDVDDQQMLQDTSNMDRSLSKNEGHNQTRTEESNQKHDLSNKSSFLQAYSLSNKENFSPESRNASCDSSADANSKLNYVQMVALQESFEHDCNDDKPQTEMSLDTVTSAHGGTSEIAELNATAAFELQTSHTIESGVLQKSEMNEIGLGIDSSLYQADFNLALEDSGDKLQEDLEKEMFLEDSENTGFQLRLDSGCSSEAQSWVEENRSSGRFQNSRIIMDSVIMDGCRTACDALMNSSNSSLVHKKKPIRRLVSDNEEEDEDNSSVIDLDEYEHQKVSPLNNITGTCMSTPKTNTQVADLCFSPRIKVSGRKSTASRRSLANVVLDQVEDLAETLDFASNTCPERDFEDDLCRRINSTIADYGQDSMETEEEPSGLGEPCRELRGAPQSCNVLRPSFLIQERNSEFLTAGGRVKI
ncbi:DNA excision repair protein ERCC-6-like [Tiliqua scincoides]|uniref:DNA excision repair protein ERCC-6-like n=1 Tax=Tiliqua scincoides TaxID=71010 RepID=UPI003461B8B5